MRYIVAFIAAFVAFPASADYALQAAGVFVRLTDQPCTDKEVLSLIRPEHQSKFRAGEVKTNRKTLALCWIVSGPGEVTVIDSEGDGGTLPMASFKKVSGS